MCKLIAEAFTSLVFRHKIPLEEFLFVFSLKYVIK